jgi:hypothetical protein
VSLTVARGRVDPAPGRRGEHQVEGLAVTLPRLERRDVDLDGHCGQVAARLLRQPRAQLDAHDREAALEQWPGGLAGPAAYLEQAGAALEPGQVDEIFEELLGVGRSSRVVQVRGRVERASQLLAHGIGGRRQGK